MSPEMARMLAEWKAREEPPAMVREKPDVLLDALKNAAPFIDAGGTPPGKWPASAVLTIGYCAIITSPMRGAEDRARDFASSMLSEARRRYKAGFFANPLGEPVSRK